VDAHARLVILEVVTTLSVAGGAVQQRTTATRGGPCQTR
jgi:hypothetical protein